MILPSDNLPQTSKCNCNVRLVITDPVLKKNIGARLLLIIFLVDNVISSSWQPSIAVFLVVEQSQYESFLVKSYVSRMGAYF